MNIKKYAFVAFVTFGFSSSISAFDYSFKSGGQYFKLYGGASHIEDINVSLSGEILPNITDDADYLYGYDTGWTVGGTFGSEIFGNFRGEVDISYSRFEADDIDGSLTFTNTLTGNTVTTGGSAPVDGDLKSLDIYTNLIYDVNEFEKVLPYFGFGVGMSRSDEELKTIGYSDDQLEVNAQEKSTSPGINLILGTELINFSNLSAGYRFGFRHVWSGDEEVSGAEVISHQFHLKYSF